MEENKIPKPPRNPTLPRDLKSRYIKSEKEIVEWFSQSIVELLIESCEKGFEQDEANKGVFDEDFLKSIMLVHMGDPDFEDTLGINGWEMLFSQITRVAEQLSLLLDDVPNKVRLIKNMKESLNKI